MYISIWTPSLYICACMHISLYVYIYVDLYISLSIYVLLKESNDFHTPGHLGL